MESSIGNIKRHGHQIACYLSDARMPNVEQTTGIKFLNIFYIYRKKRISINRNTLLSFFCTFLIMVNPAGGAGFSVKDNHIKVLS